MHDSEIGEACGRVVDDYARRFGPIETVHADDLAVIDNLAGRVRVGRVLDTGCGSGDAAAFSTAPVNQTTTPAGRGADLTAQANVVIARFGQPSVDDFLEASEKEPARGEPS